MTDSNLDLDCRIATLLGWTGCRVMIHDGGERGTSYNYAVGRDPKRPYLGDKADIPPYSTDIREVIEVCRERGWECAPLQFTDGEWYASIGTPTRYEFGEDVCDHCKEVTITDDKLYPRAAAEALAGMLEQQQPTRAGGE